MKFIIKVLDYTALPSAKSSNPLNQKSKPKKSPKELKSNYLPASTPTIQTTTPSRTPLSTSSKLTSFDLTAASSPSSERPNFYSQRKNSTKTVISKSDDIFLLEPDSIDYGDLLSQFITISSNNSEKKLKHKLLNNDNVKNEYGNASLSREYELTNSACALNCISFYFKLTCCFFFFNKFIFS